MLLPAVGTKQLKCASAHKIFVRKYPVTVFFSISFNYINIERVMLLKTGNR